jgi:hypothetical protein
MFCENERIFVSFRESRCPFVNLVVLSRFSLSFHEVQKENRIYRNFRTLFPTKGKSRAEKLNMRFWFSFLNFVKDNLVSHRALCYEFRLFREQSNFSSNSRIFSLLWLLFHRFQARKDMKQTHSLIFSRCS